MNFGNYGQVYVKEDKPSSLSVKGLFAYAVKKAKEKNLFNESMLHNQWANILFGFEKNSLLRIEYMSRVKTEYAIYFTRDLKYSFIKGKIKRDFPYLSGEKVEDTSTEYTEEDLLNDVIKVLNKEIIEQRDPQNIESFKGTDLSLVKRKEKSYVYQVKLQLHEGQEPHFHEGIPFILKVFSKELTCEAVDFDYESGQLYFTTYQSLNSASYCTIILDSSFILDSLKQRIIEINQTGFNEDYPFSKFVYDDTGDIKAVIHEKISTSITEKLDRSQRLAFHAALNNDLTFIWGPPGTGKSFTLASIIYALYLLGEDRTAICCLSNVAIDQLLCKVLDIIDGKKLIIEPGNIYRAGRTTDARIISTDYLFPNDNTTRELRIKIKENFEKIQHLKEIGKALSEESILLKAENKDLREQLKEHTDFLVRSSKLVFSTISNFILNDNLYGSKFENLIIDEASMLSMPSLLALGNRISKRLILVGDFQQLSPIAMVRDDILVNSVFEMAEINIKNTTHPALHQLLTQRRSNTKIVDLINNTFYQGKLIPTAMPNKAIVSSSPFPNRVIALKKVTDGAVRFTRGGTRQNKVFAEKVIELLDEYYEDKNAKFSIGVITPYKGQVSLIRGLKYERHYSNEFEERVKIGTVHTFQGSECDVIIFDMVDCHVLESGKKLQIGKIFKGEEGERLMNVAVSRAKHKLIVVCDPTYISSLPGGAILGNTQKIFLKLCRY